jgi:hypothetical protein
VRLDVPFDQDTVWLSQAQLSDLFGRDISVVSRHIRNVSTKGSLMQKAICKKCKLLTPTAQPSFVVFSVGYRAKSKRGTQFRIWATRKLKDYLLQGYCLRTSQHRLLHVQMELVHA